MKLGRLGERLTAAMRNATARVHPEPVLVLGNQKSGTTAIAALLASATRSSVTLDIFHRLDPDLLPALLENRLSFADFVRRNRIEFSTRIIKEPGLTFLADGLAATFPRARTVFVLRDPRDNIRSILNRLKLPGSLQALDDAHQQSLAALPGWRFVLDGRIFRTAGEGPIDTLARRWVRALDIYQAAMDRMVLVRYEDFMADKRGTIAALARRVALDPVHDITTEMDVQYQPRGDRRVRWSDFFGAKNLALIEQVCAHGMRAFGYGPTTTAGS